MKRIWDQNLKPGQMQEKIVLNILNALVFEVPKISQKKLEIYKITKNMKLSPKFHPPLGLPPLGMLQKTTISTHIWGAFRRRRARTPLMYIDVSANMKMMITLRAQSRLA